MCKHVAAVLYGVGVRLDEKPELCFTLRGMDMQELITAASTNATTPLAAAPAADTALAGADLTEIFGVEIESGAAPAPAVAFKPTPATPAKPTRPRRAVARRKPSRAKTGSAVQEPRPARTRKAASKVEAKAKQK